ncbi:MAG: alpha/beta fold hydrolase [Rhizobiaceae bacterium]
MKMFDCGGVQLATYGAFHHNTMVFQHGLCDTADFPIEAFPQSTDTSVVAMECRGHGSSEAGPPDHFTIAQFTDDLIKFIESNADEPVVIGGISMGSAIALRVAVKRRDLVKALVLGRPAWLMSSSPSNLMPLVLVGRLLAVNPNGARSAFESSLVYKTLGERFPNNLSAILDLFELEPHHVTAALLENISLDGPGVTIDEVSSINLPTLVVGTENDVIHPLDYARAFSKIIPGAGLSVITPKFDDVDRYRLDFRTALSTFLNDLN